MIHHSMAVTHTQELCTVNGSSFSSGAINKRKGKKRWGATFTDVAYIYVHKKAVNLIISLSLSFPPVFLWAREDEEHYLVASPTVCWYYDNLNGSNVLHWIGHPKIPDPPLSEDTPHQDPLNHIFFFFHFFILRQQYTIKFCLVEPRESLV